MLEYCPIEVSCRAQSNTGSSLISLTERATEWQQNPCSRWLLRLVGVVGAAVWTLPTIFILTALVQPERGGWVEEGAGTKYPQQWRKIELVIDTKWQINAVRPFAAAAAKSLQSWTTLCNPRDGSPPGSPVPEILQARTLEWVAISFSNAWKWKVNVKSLSRVRPSATPWTAAYQAPPSIGFSRQEYWSGVVRPLEEGKLGKGQAEACQKLQMYFPVWTTTFQHSQAPFSFNPSDWWEWERKGETWSTKATVSSRSGSPTTPRSGRGQT